jgi:hypothetical protein
LPEKLRQRQGALGVPSCFTIVTGGTEKKLACIKFLSIKSATSTYLDRYRAIAVEVTVVETGEGIVVVVVMVVGI